MDLETKALILEHELLTALNNYKVVSDDTLQNIADVLAEYRETVDQMKIKLTKVGVKTVVNYCPKCQRHHGKRKL